MYHLVFPAKYWREVKDAAVDELGTCRCAGTRSLRGPRATGSGRRSDDADEWCNNKRVITRLNAAIISDWCWRNPAAKRSNPWFDV
jgi:hypothetical protein